MTTATEAYIERIASETVFAMSPLTNEERKLVFDKLKERYCEACGGRQPYQSKCNCTRDE